jgi:hypothetical protein
MTAMLRRFLKIDSVLIALLAIAARSLPTPRTIDDAFITFRYARNLVAGSGFVFNAGQHVLGDDHAAIHPADGRAGGQPACFELSLGWHFWSMRWPMALPVCCWCRWAKGSAAQGLWAWGRRCCGPSRP